MATQQATLPRRRGRPPKNASLRAATTTVLSMATPAADVLSSAAPGLANNTSNSNNVLDGLVPRKRRGRPPKNANKLATASTVVAIVSPAVKTTSRDAGGLGNSNSNSNQNGSVPRRRGRPPKNANQPTPTIMAVAVATPVPTPNPTPAVDTISGDDTGRGISDSSSNSNLNELEERVNDLENSWEMESLLEDVLNDSDDERFLAAEADPEVCTMEEAIRYRRDLRAVGPEEFCRRTVDSGAISAKKLLTAFGVRPPSFLDGEPDDSYFGLLSLALSRELLKRAKLQRYNTVDDAVQLLQTSQNIIVLTGAGISTSLGIPDFRSKNTGLYSRLAHLGLSDPQEVFDINVFREDPTIFYSVARDILPATDRFTPTHAFIAMLQQRGKLLTNYSQNIDNLEAKAGILPSKLIQCHGSFATASCVRCGYRVVGETIFPTIKAGHIPHCPQCATAATAATAAKLSSQQRRVLSLGRKQRKALVREAAVTARSSGSGSVSRTHSLDDVTALATSGAGASAPRGRGRPRGRPPKNSLRRPRGRPPRQKTWFSDDEDEDDGGSGEGGGGGGGSTVGVMKPDITFFGESLPDEFSRRLTEHDRDRVDLVVVIGTSLKVAPVSEVVPFMPPHIPQIYISRTPVSHINFDIDLLGDCDVVVAELCRRLGWDLRHEMVPAHQQVHVETLPHGTGSQHVFTDRTPGVGVAEEAKTATAGAWAGMGSLAMQTMKVETDKDEV